MQWLPHKPYGGLGGSDLTKRSSIETIRGQRLGLQTCLPHFLSGALIVYLQPGYYDRFQEMNSGLSLIPSKEMDSPLGKENFSLTSKSLKWSVFQSVGHIRLINFYTMRFTCIVAMCLGKREVFTRWNVLTQTGRGGKKCEWSGCKIIILLSGCSSFEYFDPLNSQFVLQ